MLHKRRKRLAELAEREASGETFWTDVFEEPLRVKIVHLIREISNGWDVFTTLARQYVLVDEGRFFLSNATYNDVYDFEHYLLTGPDDMVPTLIEAWAAAAADGNAKQRTGRWGAGETFETIISGLLREHRVSFELSNGEMIPLASLELHSEVVLPTLRLLGSVKGWGPVETSYRNALAELSKGDAADAVTDAGTALQEALTLLGCEGNALGPLIKSARQKGLISSHDEPMADALLKIANWVSADRSNTGDTHNAAPALVEDAWFIVHVVGALILRLSKGTSRPK